MLLYEYALPCEPMNVTPGTEPPCPFWESRPYARPIVAFAWLYGPIAPMPAFMPISWRTGPLTTVIVAPLLDVLWRAVTHVAPSARMTGKYSGRAPAITAFTATFSTVYSHASRKCVGRMRPTTSFGFRLVARSIAATRSSVGSTIGR